MCERPVVSIHLPPFGVLPLAAGRHSTTGVANGAWFPSGAGNTSRSAPLIGETGKVRVDSRLRGNDDSEWARE